MDREGKRWVMWTPEGPYDASPGGEGLIGWHVNRGLDHAADFFGVSRFRDRYYRPNFVEAVLRGQDIEEALRETRAPAKAPTPQLWADPPQEPYGEITRPTLYPTTP
jgi:hypothetical protein